jgi:hypothetical protein
MSVFTHSQGKGGVSGGSSRQPWRLQIQFLVIFPGMAVVIVGKSPKTTKQTKTLAEMTRISSKQQITGSGNDSNAYFGL